MTIGQLMAIACFISPNPSPWNWLVSGSKQNVAALEQRVGRSPSIRRVARASDGPIAFARFEIDGNMRYGDHAGLLAELPRFNVMSLMQQTIPSCSDGRQEDLGNPHAPPVVVGVIGASEAVAEVLAEIGSAKPRPLVLGDGKTGVQFEPVPEESDGYAKFVARAAKGAWPRLQIVLLRGK